MHATAIRPEAVIDRALPIVDAHHHLFDRTPLIPGAAAYLLHDFAADLHTGHLIEASVFVEVQTNYRAAGPEALRPLGEVEFVCEMAARDTAMRTRVAAAIVGFADLRLGARVRPVLEGLRVACDGRFRGVRFITAADPDPAIDRIGRPAGLLQDKSFRAGFAELAPLGLSFDAWLHHTQLTELIELARLFPETRIVLDHVGGPLRIGGYAAQREIHYQQWRAQVALLARLPNVFVKLGGFGMRFYGWPEPPDDDTRAEFLAEQWRPYIEPCIEAFGPSRCMFESNFPVDKSYCDYRSLWNAYKIATRGYTAAERAALFHDTAARCYGLSLTNR